MQEIIKNRIDTYDSLTNSEEGKMYSRYKSWKYCHKFFKENKDKARDGDKEIIDHMALHLAFYLASWGMYRGSSFLLQCDYKIHKEIVKEIIKKDYDALWDYNPNKKDEKEVLRLLFGVDEKKVGIYYKIEKHYRNILSTVDREAADEKEFSETLVTKILLGTFACVPAYDRFFKEGIKIYNIKKNDDKLKQKFCGPNIKKHFEFISNFIMSNKDAFEHEEYPPMKCLDMFFWQVGYEATLLNDKKKIAKNEAVLRKMLKIENIEEIEKKLIDRKKEIENMVEN